MKVITFISDFGDRDWFVGAVKGEILKINKNVSIVDITHRLVPHDIQSAAFVVKSVYKNFARGSIHLVVVDPGVGSKRKPLIVQSDGYYFVGPDNGVFSYVYKKNSKVFEIKQKGKLSSTFHARDIFGPAAARLSKGIKPITLGKTIENYAKFKFPLIEEKKGKVVGEVVYIDQFGNCITNIPNTIAVVEFRIAKRRIAVTDFYGEGKVGKLMAVRGSSGYYEIASNKGSAQKILKAVIGLAVKAHTL